MEAIRAQGKSLAGRSFYLTMMLVITALILFGFSHTIVTDVLDPAETPPIILYVHVITYTAWLAVLITQTLLVWLRNPRLHRKLGVAGAVFALFMVAIGLATTVAMGQFQVERHGPEAAMFIYRPFEDIAFFAIAFGLAVHWRKKPDIHRRLMVLAACALTPPGISRIPLIHSLGAVYAVTDLLILAGVFHDFVSMRKVHRVYVWGLPIALTGQGVLLYIMQVKPAWTVSFAHYVTQ